MAREQNFKMVCLKDIGTVATNATSFTSVDTLGWDYAKVIVLSPAAAATNSSNAWTSIEFTHGTTTDTSNHTNLFTGTSGTASATQFALPINNNVNLPQIVVFCKKLDGSEERFVGVRVQANANHSTTVAIAELTRGTDVKLNNEGWFGNEHRLASTNATTVTARNSAVVVVP